VARRVEIVEVPKLDAVLEDLESREPAELQARAEEYELVLEELEKLQIQTPEDYEFVGEQLQYIKGLFKEIDLRRKAAVAPLNKAKGVLQGWYKPPLNFLEKCEKALKQEIGRYQLALKQANADAMRRAAEASQRDDFEAVQRASQAIQRRPERAGISVRDVWKYRVVDKLKVPEDFKVVDHSKLEALCRSSKSVKPTPVPGIEFYQDAQVIARAK